MTVVVLDVLGRYRSSLGEWEAGGEVHCSEDEADALLRDSPGSFAVQGSKPKPAAKKVGRSTTTTGVAASDRRARGGTKRGS